MLKLSRSTSLLQKVVGNGFSQVRMRSGRPTNTVVIFVPQQEAWVVERFGKFNKILEPGLNFLLPIVDRIQYVQSLKEIAIDIPSQSAITTDNVTLNLDGVLYVRVIDPYKASYGVEDAQYAITQLAQTTMRSELGKIQLDTVFKERDNLNYNIVESINKAAESWGIDALRYEIRDIQLPDRVQIAMQMQVEAERKKRAAILESEGIREAEINVAEGKKKSRILTSEAFLTEAINEAKGEAEATVKKAEAKAEAIERVAQALGQKDGKSAVSVEVAEKYISAFGKLAKEGNTVLLPSSTGDVSGMVSQAMAIYNTMNQSAVKSMSDASNQEGNEVLSQIESIASVESQVNNHEKRTKLNDNEIVKS